MGQKVKKIRQKVSQSDYDEVPIGANAENVDFKDGQNLEEKMNEISNVLQWGTVED